MQLQGLFYLEGIAGVFVTLRVKYGAGSAKAWATLLVEREWLTCCHKHDPSTLGHEQLVIVMRRIMLFAIISISIFLVGIVLGVQLQSGGVKY